MRFAFACAAFIVGAGCASGLADGGGGSGSVDATGGGGAGGAGQDGGGGSSSTTGPIGTGGACDAGCTGDGSAVTDCHGTVIDVCEEGETCWAEAGYCVDACALAESTDATVGCSFASVLPGPQIETYGSCFAAFIANTWSSPVAIEVARDGVAFDTQAIARIPSGAGAQITYEPLPGGELPPGEVAILFLTGSQDGAADSTPCPVAPAVPFDSHIAGTGRGKAFTITTNRPVVAYDIYPYGGATSYVTSATLLLPTSSWGSNYVAMDAYAGFQPFLQIVGVEDTTTVTIEPSADIQGGPGVAAAVAGQPVSYVVDAGEVLQLMQPERLAGSVVEADKPIGLWGGADCMNVPVGTYACDSAHQQLAPVSALGHEYIVTRYHDRLPNHAESAPHALVGAVDGTVLTYAPAPPPGAPATLNRGMHVEVWSSQPFVVRSQDEDHPFAVFSYMTGASTLPDTNQGDPEFVVSLPPEQWLTRYVFFSDPTYGHTSLVIVRGRGEDGYADVTLDCSGVITEWQPLTADYEIAHVDVVAQGAPQQGCNNGVLVAESELPFSVTVWGWDQWASYAYPAGAGLRHLNDVVVQPE